MIHVRSYSLKGGDPINIIHLKYAVEVEKTGSITLAAENLYMNQPNLSKAIKELEGMIGFNIFKRTPKGMIPTKRGEEFLGYARRILTQVGEMESLFIKSKKKSINLSYCIPRASYLSYAFTNFLDHLDKSKEWDVSIRETNNMDTITKVSEGDCQLGIIRYRRDHEEYFYDFLKSKGLSHEDLWEFEYMILISAQGVYAKKQELSYLDLKEGVEIVHGDITVPHLPLSDWNQKEQDQKRKIYVYERGSQFDILGQIRDSYMWVSPLPVQMLERYGLVQRNVQSVNLIVKDVVIRQKEYRLSEMELAFLQEISKVKNSMIRPENGQI